MRIGQTMGNYYQNLSETQTQDKQRKQKKVMSDSVEDTTDSYDPGEAWELHQKQKEHALSPEENEYYHSARRNDPKLDIAMYESDKAEVLKEVGQVQNILMKASNGQELTEEEKEMVRNDPALQMEIARRQMERFQMRS